MLARIHATLSELSASCSRKPHESMVQTFYIAPVWIMMLVGSPPIIGARN
jgi:hypothetical protein